MKRNALIIDTILDREGWVDIKARRYQENGPEQYGGVLDLRACRREALEQLSPAQLKRQFEAPDITVWPDGREFKRAPRPQMPLKVDGVKALA